MIEVSGLSKVFNRLMPGRIDRLNQQLMERVLEKTSITDLWTDIESLLRRGADINAPSASGNLVLNVVCGQNLPDVAEKLINLAGADVHLASGYGTTPLMMAGRAGDDVTMKLLLDKGVDITAKNKDGANALYEVIHGDPGGAAGDHVRQSQCLKLLLAQGAVLDQDHKFHIYKHQEHLAFADPDIVDAKALVKAAQDGDLGKLKELLDAGISPDLPCRFATNPPLFYAAREGNLQMIELLHQAGVNPKEGPPPLIVAAEFAQRRAFEALMDIGADPAAPWPGGKTIFEFARQSSDPGMETFIVDLLKERNRPPEPDVTLSETITTMPRLRLKNSGPV